MLSLLFTVVAQKKTTIEKFEYSDGAVEKHRQPPCEPYMEIDHNPLTPAISDLYCVPFCLVDSLVYVSQNVPYNFWIGIRPFHIA